MQKLKCRTLEVQEDMPGVYSVLSEAVKHSEALYSLMVVGMKDFLWRSVLHLGSLSLSLNVLLRSAKSVCSG